MNWHKERIINFYRDYKKEILLSVIFILSLTAYHIFSNELFVPRKYEFLPDPNLTLRILSALVFGTLGRILYKLKFYKILHIIFVVIFRNKEVFESVKKVIWDSMMLIMGFWVAPAVINLLNNILSFIYNVILWLVYIFTPVGVIAILLLTTFLAVKYLFANRRALKL